MNQETRDLIFEVVEGEVNLLSTIHRLSRYRDFFKILFWLKTNNIKGKNLIDWLSTNHNNSILKMVKFIVKKPIKIGKDWA